MLLWAYYFYANFLDGLGRTQEALQYIDRAVSHTPTVVDLYLCRGRIYRHAGDVLRASYWANYARELDLADRYLNVKCTKFFLRADNPEKAEATALLFTKHGDNTLHDMQAMWYELELADSYRRQNKLNLALKYYALVMKHFTEIQDDQMDFHSYALRKMTARAYLSMLRMEDQNRAHQNFLRATVAMVEIYLSLHDSPKKNESEQIADQMAGLSIEEQKKLLKKKKREDAKKAELEAAEALKQEKAKKTGKKVDDDPEGLKLLNVADPLAEALKYFRAVENVASDKMETHLIGFEVYFRSKKNLLMLRCIKRGLRLDPTHPGVHAMIIRYFLFVDSVKESMPKSVLEVVDFEREAILGKLSLSDFNSEYLAKSTTLAQKRAAVSMRVNFLSSAEEKQSLLGSLKDFISELKDFTCNPLHDHIQAYEFIKSVDASLGEAVFEICAAHFPLSRSFHVNLPVEDGGN